MAVNMAHVPSSESREKFLKTTLCRNNSVNVAPTSKRGGYQKENFV